MRKSTLFAIAAGMMVASAGAFSAYAQDENAVKYVLDPAPGVATELTTIGIEFPDNKNVEFYENSRMPVAVLVNNSTGAEYVCNEAERNTFAQTEGIAYTLTFVAEDATEEDELLPINEPGDYTLTVKGLCTVEGEGEDAEYTDLPVITADYTVKYPVSYTLSPAPGAEGITNLQNIVLTFNEPNCGFVENARPYVASLVNNTTGSQYICKEADRNTRAEVENGSEWNLVFIPEGEEEAVAINEPGDYTLTIRNLTQVVEGEEGEETTYEPLPNIVAEYSLNYPEMYVLDPVDGAVVTELSTVSIEFENKAVAFYENNRMPVAVLVNNNTGAEYVCNEAERNTFAQSEGIVYDLNFLPLGEEEAESISAPGNYTLTIKGLYVVEGEGEDEEYVDLPVITANYAIEYPVNYMLSPLPGVAQNLKTITLEFAEKNVAFIDNMRPAVATLENLNTGVVYYATEADRNTFAPVDGVEYNLTFINSEELGNEDAEVVDITEPGEYQLTIRGMYLEGEDAEVIEWLPEIKARYTIEYPVSYVLTPMEGEVQDLMTVSIEFPYDNNVAFYEPVMPFAAVLTNLQTGDEYVCKEADRNTFAMTEGVVYDLTFISVENVNEEDAVAEPITTPGAYMLTIKGLYQEVGTEEESEKVDLPVITAGYTISYPVEYVLDPANGAVVQNLKTITLEFPANTNVEFYENNQMAVAVLENVDAEMTWECKEAVRNTFAESEGVAYTLTFVPEGEEEAIDITAQGTYVLTIKALALVEETEGEDGIEKEYTDLPVINAKYVMGFPVDYELNPTDGSTVEDLMEIVLTFPNNTNVAFYENNPMPVAVLENLMTGTIYNCDEAVRNTFAETEGVAYTLTFVEEDAEEAAPIIEDGVYYLTIRALGFVTVNEDETEEISGDIPVINATYYLVNDGTSAVETIGGENAENEVYNVYTINGIQVVRNGNADSVRGLGAGLYIINGKKVIIRN